jgi:flagellar biogenesis protein FliO
MFEFLAIALLLIVLTIYIVWRIIKLPSRYERRPRELSPWNALDIGIDPSITQNPKE